MRATPKSRLAGCYANANSDKSQHPTPTFARQKKTTLPPQSVDILQIRATFLYTLYHAHFTFAHPLTRVVIAFVGFLRPIGVAYLSLQIAFFRLVKIQKALPICPLCVGVDVHLHNPVRKS